MNNKINSKLHELISNDYLIRSVSEHYCSAIKKIDGKDRYVILKLVGDRWIVISQ